MTSGFTPPEGVTAPLLYYDPAHPPDVGAIAGKILVFQTAPYPNPPYSNSFLDNYTPTDYGCFNLFSASNFPPRAIGPLAGIRNYVSTALVLAKNLQRTIFSRDTEVKLS